MNRLFILKSPAVRDNAALCIQQIDLAELHAIHIAPYEEYRNNEQNKLLHAIFREISLATGSSPGAVKEYYRRKFLPAKHEPFNGEVQEVRQSTTKLSKRAFAEFVEQVLQDAAELGIVVNTRIGG